MKTITYNNSKNLSMSDMKEIRNQAKKLIDVTFCFVTGYYCNKGYDNYISLGNAERYLLGKVERDITLDKGEGAKKFKFSNFATWSDATKSFRVEIANNDDVLVMMISLDEVKEIKCEQFGRISNPVGVSLDLKNTIENFLNTLKY